MERLKGKGFEFVPMHCTRPGWVRGGSRDQGQRGTERGVKGQQKSRSWESSQSLQSAQNAGALLRTLRRDGDRALSAQKPAQNAGGGDETDARLTWVAYPEGLPRMFSGTAANCKVAPPLKKWTSCVSGD